MSLKHFLYVIVKEGACDTPQWCWGRSLRGYERQLTCELVIGGLLLLPLSLECVFCLPSRLQKLPKIRALRQRWGAKTVWMVDLTEPH